MTSPQNQNPAEDLRAMPTDEESHHFTVVGSGVIGLLTANALADRGHAVTVISKEGQPNQNTDSTSSIAVGQFLPWLPEAHADTVMGSMTDELQEVVERGREFYSALAQNPAETGVMPVHNIELVSEDIPWSSGLPEAMHVEEHKLEEPIELTGADGKKIPFDEKYDFDTFSINTRKTVAWLAGQAKQKGVDFVAGHITPELLRELDGVVINATGIGAQELTGSEDIKHYKGHTIVIRPPEGMALKEGISVDDLIIFPREDGTIVAGALYRENPSRPTPEGDEAIELKDRLTELATKAGDLVEGLDPRLFSEGEVVMHSAGYRVVIESGGIRVEPDQELEHVLHAYGFSGIGWSVGPAFAKRIAEQAVSMHNKLQGGNDEQ